MRNLKICSIFFYFLSISLWSNTQKTSVEYIETDGIIKEIIFKMRGHRSSATATVSYKKIKGYNLSSKVKLMHIPFIGSLDKEGLIIKVLYNKNIPLLFTG
ncbi:hypothetical protein [Aquimarina sp. RZ0]|uniref:hypothetical protein n=1 Tax=Aquimarina sp. RZ0 TaxID=2607730 RepID=UPI0011F257AA|nr:hypothetical protein [Aquimarina sp. RZ0]KAA1244465.1 hypothetical protein F0000_16605 [Aquimarina sp. RZ0]